MKKVFYFIAISIFNSALWLYNKTVRAQDIFETATTKYGAQISTGEALFGLGILIGIIVVFIVGIFRLFRFIWKKLKTQRKSK